MEPRYNEVLGITNDFLYPSNRKIYGDRGGSRIFYRRGCTLLLLYSNTNKPQLIPGRGGGGRTPCTLPLDPPLGEEPRYNETLLWGTNLASPLAFRYIEVPHYKGHCTCFCGRAAESAHHQVPEAIMKFLSHCSGPLNCSSFHFSMLGNSGASIHF